MQGAGWGRRLATLQRGLGEVGVKTARAAVEHLGPDRNAWNPARCMVPNLDRYLTPSQKSPEPTHVYASTIIPKYRLIGL